MDAQTELKQTKKILVTATVIMSVIALFLLGYIIRMEKRSAKDRHKTELIDGRTGVDLALSVIWATQDIGADSPTDEGDTFTWDEAMQLETEGGWRLPTDEEAAELAYSCRWDYDEKGDPKKIIAIGRNDRELYFQDMTISYYWTSSLSATDSTSARLMAVSPLLVKVFPARPARSESAKDNSLAKHVRLVHDRIKNSDK